MGLWVLSLLSSFDYSWYFYEDGMIEMEGVRQAEKAFHFPACNGLFETGILLLRHT